MDRVSDVVGEAVRNLRGAGFGAVREFLSRSYRRYGRGLSADPVFDADWDLLVVLDACRADLWAEVVDPDSVLPVGTTRVSPGGTSTEWLKATFGEARPERLSSTGYVTANPYSADHVDGAALGHLREVWRDAWDDDLGTVRPRAVTDAAIRAGREHDLDRLVVHYMQPHFPSIVDGRDDGVELEAFGDEPLSVWEDLRFGRCSRAEVWRAYRANLRAVLPEVELLLSNIDADRAVITADHGNAVGERGLYGHAAGLALRPLREVPWAVTTAADTGSHELPAAAAAVGETASAEVAARLERLGYR
ncbi:hypothetical protein BRD14_07920 [Halobacteriales archaeon SW_5_68_122]|nr:MAG: hypothetical protein BRD14_07920 [Halobacteriales archaeon SW_5_68_122]